MWSQHTKQADSHVLNWKNYTLHGLDKNAKPNCEIEIEIVAPAF